MKYFPFWFFLLIFISGCNNTLNKNDISSNSSAILGYNVDEIYLRSVDGIPYKHHPSDFASNKLKVSPGKHVVAATLYWVSSYDGRNFSTQTENTIKKVCFIARQGKSYLVVARFNKKQQWYPVVLSSWGFGGEVKAELCET